MVDNISGNLYFLSDLFSCNILAHNLYNSTVTTVLELKIMTIL